MPLLDSSGLPRRKSDAWQQLVDRVAVLVEKARRKGAVLSIGAETDRLIGEYPNCPMSPAELRDTITRVARTQNVEFAA
jgi:hypothetical protein